MDRYHLPKWLLAALAASGGFGIFLVAFADSSFLPFPSVNDLLLINLSIQSPRRMPYYALMSMIGSLVGSVVLFLIARKGEEAAFHKQAGPHAQRVHRWMKRNGFISILIAALLPPPTPFKLFILAAGLLEMPFRSFILAIAIARGVRFFGEGYLAIRYGNAAIQFLTEHKIGFAVGALAIVVAFYLIYRLIGVSTAPPESDENKPA